MRLNWQWTALLSLSVASYAGCGGEAPPTEQAAAKTEKGVVPPAAAIGVETPAPEDDVKIEKPKEGSPEALIFEMTQLWTKPIPETDDIAKLRAARKERNLKIVGLADEVIGKTHKDKEKEHLFNLAVHRMLEATMQLAMAGDSDSEQALYDYARDFYARDPKAKSAAEAGWFLAKFAFERADSFADKEPRWINEFAKQSRSFADKFGSFDAHRAVMLLNDAAATCDYYGQRQDALLCYMAIKQSFPESRQAEHVVAPLRRLELVGKSVDLGGPTIDGGFTTVEEFKGAPVLVVFWSTQAQPFVDASKEIIATTRAYEEKGLNVIGVNLDTDESAIDAFAEKTGMSWRNIFHTDVAKRGWSHPIVTYYGVPTLPQMWLVNAEGRVVSTHVDPQQLDTELAKLIPGVTTKTATAPKSAELKTEPKSLDPKGATKIEAPKKVTPTTK